MRFFYITFRSVTYAQRGEKILRKQDMKCQLLRTPRWMEEQGCGYALKIWAADVIPAVELLRQESVPLRRVYRQRREGDLEELMV